MKYFYNYKILEIELPEQGYKVGIDIEEKDTFIPLNEQQIIFYNDNQNASAMEVWNCKLNPPAPQPTPIELFSFTKFTSDLRLELGARIIAIDQYAYSIMKNVELKDFVLAKQLILGHIQAGHLIQSDYDIFKSVLLKQDINLDLC